MARFRIALASQVSTHPRDEPDRVTQCRWEVPAFFFAAPVDEIAQLYLHVDYQRQGIGSELLRWAKDPMRPSAVIGQSKSDVGRPFPVLGRTR